MEYQKLEMKARDFLLFHINDAQQGEPVEFLESRHGQNKVAQPNSCLPWKKNLMRRHTAHKMLTFPKLLLIKYTQLIQNPPTYNHVFTLLASGAYVSTCKKQVTIIRTFLEEFHFNEALCKALGYTRKETVGTKLGGTRNWGQLVQWLESGIYSA